MDILVPVFLWINISFVLGAYLAIKLLRGADLCLSLYKNTKQSVRFIFPPAMSTIVVHILTNTWHYQLFYCNLSGKCSMVFHYGFSFYLLD